jgi:hypothetical protein
MAQTVIADDPLELVTLEDEFTVGLDDRGASASRRPRCRSSSGSISAKRDRLQEAIPLAQRGHPMIVGIGVCVRECNRGSWPHEASLPNRFHNGFRAP